MGKEEEVLLVEWRETDADDKFEYAGRGTS